jgi:antitoxin component YwqK of YwqJK toxin-antitoxin module
LVNGKREGLWKVYDRNGILREVNNYKDGKLNGAQETYDSLGRLYTMAHRYNDAFVDSFKLYYENGQLRTENWFDSSGKSQGIYKIYYRNGKLNVIGRDVNGISVDTTWAYEENGELQYIECYKNGSNGKTVTYFDSQRKPIYTQYFEGDSLKSEKHF